MPKGIFLVQSGPADPAHRAAFNEWYSGTHVPEVLAIPGFVGARRFERVNGEAAHDYLAVYEIDGDDLGAPLAELNRRMASGEMTMPRGVRFDGAPVTTLYRLLD